MRLILTAFLILTSIKSLAETQYCGKLMSLTFQTDIYTVIRMGVSNPELKPNYITVKDEDAIVDVIRLISNNPTYTHKTDMDDFSWFYKEDKNNYFICIKGSELRNYSNRFYMDKVESLKVWKNEQSNLIQ